RQTAPSVGRVPWLDGLHLVAVRIEFCGVAETHADKLEPFGLAGRRGVYLGAVHADQRAPIFVSDSEALGLLLGHLNQVLGAGGSVLKGAAAAPLVGITCLGGAFADMMRSIDRAIVLD